MTMQSRKLARPPIVEAVLDIDCDLPPKTNIRDLEETARERFRGQYPKFKTRHLFEHELQAKADEPPQTKTRRGIQGYMFLQEDEKQLVQVRAQGYSFNRLAPYTELDDYLPEVERTWAIFLELAQPVQVTAIRLRYINRINLPFREGKVELDEYLKLGPRLPDEERLTFKGFLNQYVAGEVETGNEVKAILTSQKPEGDKLPIIFDITAAQGKALTPGNWKDILAAIQSLRNLKNDVFFKTLKGERCLTLFQ